jgi:hypothetical protein
MDPGGYWPLLNVGLVLAAAALFLAKLAPTPAPVFPGLKVALHGHLVFEPEKNLWTLNSFLNVPNQANGSPDATTKTLTSFEESLKSQGWQVSTDSKKGLACSKVSTYQENVSKWRLSSTQTIPMVEARIAVDDQSDVEVDAPKGMVIETFPPVAKKESLVIKDMERMHISLHYAPDESPYLNLKTSTQTIWGRILTGLVWLVTKGLGWLIGTVVVIVGTLLREKLLDQTKRLFSKKRRAGITKEDIPKVKTDEAKETKAEAGGKT